MKRILMLGLLALSLLCGTAFAKTGEGMTIWFDTGGSVGDGYGTIVQNGAKAAAADMGCELRLLYSDWNPETMITHFRNAVAARPDGIVVMGHPGDAAFGPLVDAAVKQGIVVTSIDTALPETQARHRAKGFGYVGTDNYTQGKALAEEVLRRTNLKKGDRAFVWGLKRIPDRGRRAQAIVEMLEQAGGLSGNHPRNRQGPRARCPGRGGAARASPRHQGHHCGSRLPDRADGQPPQERGRQAEYGICGGILAVSGDGGGH